MLSLQRSALSGRVAARPNRGAVKVFASAEVSPTKPGTGYEYALTLPGISEPFPNMFDPAGFATNSTINEMRRWRESEITHGRVAMLAALGFVVGEQLEDFPAFYNADGHITGPAIYQFQQVEARGAVFWEPLILAIGLAESYRVASGWANPKGTGFNALKGDDEYQMGDLGFDPLGLKPTDPEELKVMQTKELNNGRLAMISIAAFVVQELVKPGTEVFEHLFLALDKEILAEEGTLEKEVEAVETVVEKDLGLLTILPVPHHVFDNVHHLF